MRAVYFSEQGGVLSLFYWQYFSRVVWARLLGGFLYVWLRVYRVLVLFLGG